MKLYYMQGLPDSGKSHYAMQLLKEQQHILRINKDELRLMLIKAKDYADIFEPKRLAAMLYGHGKQDEFVANLSQTLQEQMLPNKSDIARATSHKAREQWVRALQEAILREAVAHGLNIIVDDTNLNMFHFKLVKHICEGYDVEFINMHERFGVTVNQCLTQNKKRKQRVPEELIIKMAEKHGIPLGDQKMSAVRPFYCEGKYVVCDIDGTLADLAHREQHVQGNKRDWDAFFAELDKDELHAEVKGLLDYTYPNLPVVLVTGRPDTYRAATEAWLAQHGVRYDAMYMRAADDKRPDTTIKQEILDKYLDKDKIEVSIDDRNKVVAMWRSNGINVIHVHPKSF